MDENQLDNLEVGEQENVTPVEQDNSHPDQDKEVRYKQQLQGSKAENDRLRNLVIDREVKAASKDARSLLELHEADPKLANEVAKKFGYDDFEDAKAYIDQKFSNEESGGIEKTTTASFEENFEKFYQERKAKETHDEAMQRADKILGKIKDAGAKEKAKKYFDKIVGSKQLTIDEAEEFAEMATLYVNKDSLKAERYEEGLSNYSSTGMGMGGKPTATQGKVEVVRNGKIVYLDTNNS